MDKYRPFLEQRFGFISENTIKNFESTIQKIYELEDVATTLRYKENDWEEAFNLCKDEYNLPLMLSFIKAKGVPVDYIEKVFNILSDKDKFFILLSDSINVNIINKVINRYGVNFFSNILDRWGSYFSQNALFYLCCLDAPTLNDLDFIPFKYINTDNSIASFLKTVIENCYDSEKLNNIVVNNKSLPDDVRNFAFDKGCNPYSIFEYTNYIGENMYRSCVETLFCLTPESYEQKLAQSQSDTILQNMLDKGQMSLSQQLDFINNIKANPDISTKTFEKIITTTQFPQVLKEVIDCHSIKNIFELISENRKALTCDVIKKALNYTSTMSMCCACISAMFSSPIDGKTAMIFLNFGDISFKRAFITSLHTPENIVNMMNLQNEDTAYKDELNFLRELRSVVYNHIEPIARQKIMNFATMQFIYQDETYIRTDVYANEKTPCHRLLTEIQEGNEKKWFPISQENINLLNETIDSLSKKYPQFSEVCRKLSSQLYNLEHDQKIVKKYPKIFKIDTDKKDMLLEDRLPFTHINFKEICNLSEKDMKEFIYDVKVANNKHLRRSLFDTMETTISDYKIFTDETYKAIYKCCDLYEYLSHQVKEDFLKEKSRVSDYDELPFSF